MKRVVLALVLLTGFAHAQEPGWSKQRAVATATARGVAQVAQVNPNAVWVAPHWQNGVWVQGYWRSAPDNTVRNNYDHRGNVNPYTGQPGQNYDRNNPTSEYYQGQQARPGQLYCPTCRMPALYQGPSPAMNGENLYRCQNGHYCTGR